MRPSTTASTVAPAPRGRWTLEFRDPEAELEFAKDSKRRSLMPCRIGLALLLCLAVLNLLPLVSVIPVGAALVLTRSEVGLRLRHLMACFCACMCVAAIVVPAARFHAPYDSLAAIVLVPVVGVIGCAQGLLCVPFKWLLGTNVALLCEFVILLFASGWWASWKDLITVLVPLFFLSGSITWGARVNECMTRRVWMAWRSNCSLASEIQVLKEELSRVGMQGEKAMDLDSPVEKVISVLGELRDLAGTGTLSTQDIVSKMGYAISTLTKHTELFAADLGSQIKAGKGGIDDETAKWLLEEIAAKGEIGDGLSLLSTVNCINVPLDSSTTTVNISGEDVIRWGFDVFKLKEDIGMENVLPAIADAVLNYSGIYETLSLSPKKTMNFVRKVNSMYHEVPFHNQLHAADVLQTLCSLVAMVGENTFTPLERLGLYIAAIAHDVDHPGLNNAFQIATRSELALRYNDKSVLENHHAATAFSVACSDDCDFFTALSRKEQNDVRALVIDLILATDMSRHLDMMAMFNMKISAGLDFSNANDRLVAMRCLIKAADVGNVAKPLDLQRKWGDLVTAEFFLQGDRERELGLPVSAFMDRTQTNVAKSQIGFIDFVGLPLFESMCTLLNDSEAAVLREHIQGNRAYWQGASKANPAAPLRNFRPHPSALAMNIVKASIRASQSRIDMHCPSTTRGRVASREDSSVSSGSPAFVIMHRL
eukprot:m51a1_g6777 putative camp-specific 3 -cyclic phosphodiesterase (709) ;mRNA; f:127105-129811